MWTLLCGHYCHTKTTLEIIYFLRVSHYRSCKLINIVDEKSVICKTRICKTLNSNARYSAILHTWPMK